MSRYDIKEETKEKFLPVIKEFIWDIESDENRNIDLSDTDLNPYTLMSILEDLGYIKEDVDVNGWEMDFSIKMISEGARDINIYGCGITFELTLSS